MKALDAAQAKNLMARFHAGEDVSDEEVDFLADYLARNAPENDEVKAEPTAERGRHLRLALQYHKLLNELLS